MQTSQKSIFDIIEETSTSSAEGFLVSPTQAQGNDLEKKMTATSGQKCLDAFGRFSRNGSWARMFSALLIGQEGWSSTKCRLTWKLKGTRFSRMYFQLQASTLPTEEIGSGLLLTPTSVMTDEPPEKMRERAERNGYKNGTQYGSLLSQVKYSGMLPTPTAGEHKHGKTDKYWQNRIEKGRQEDLSMQAYKGMLPTPTTDSASNRKNKYKQGGTPLSVAIQPMIEEDGKTSQLNPQFVEEMMGFPENWTVSPFQSGETKA
jgi:hypothetical protein